MQPHGILESALYAPNLSATADFYVTVLGLTVDSQLDDRHVFFKFASGMLLLFNPAETQHVGHPVNGSIIPAHGATGAGHIAFCVFERELTAWRGRLRQHHVPIESEVTWPGGGHSLYFRDPAGNSVELATPALWKMQESRDARSADP